jgi:putative flippase GtrA
MQQLIRYGLVGIASNLILYFAYLMITYVGVSPKTALTVCYVVGVVQTFYFNRGWTFGHDGKVSVVLVRCVTAYGMSYVFNSAVLMVFVGCLGYVYGAAIIHHSCMRII